MFSTAEIPLTITGNTVTGDVVLAPDAVIGLSLTGDILGDVRTTWRGAFTGPQGLHAIAITAIIVNRTNLLVKGNTVTTEEIRISGVHDGNVRFSGHTHRELHLRINEATAKKVHWDLKAKK